MSDRPLHLLLADLAQGDATAWSLACEQLIDDMRRVAMKILRDPHHVEDVVQDALLALRESSGRFQAMSDDAAGDARRYCRAIAAHLALKARRSQVRARTMSLNDLAPTMTQAAADEVPDLPMREQLQQALSQLAEPFAQAVTLHHLGGLSCDQVASIQGVRPATARTRIWRGIQGLRRQLGAVSAATAGEQQGQHRFGLKNQGKALSVLALLALFRDLSASLDCQPPAEPVVQLLSPAVSLPMCLSASLCIAFVLAVSLPIEGRPALVPDQRLGAAGGLGEHGPAQSMGWQEATARRVFVLSPDVHGDLRGLSPIDGPETKRYSPVKPWLRASPSGADVEPFVRDGQQYMRYTNVDGRSVEEQVAANPPHVGLSLAGLQQAMQQGFMDLASLAALCRIHGTPIPASFIGKEFLAWDGQLPAGLDQDKASALRTLSDQGVQIMHVVSEQGDRILHWMHQYAGPMQVPALDMVAILVQADGSISWLSILPKNG